MASLRGLPFLFVIGLLSQLASTDDWSCPSLPSCTSSNDRHDLQRTVTYLQGYLRQVLAGVDSCTLPKDCSDVYQSGVRQNGHYDIQPVGFCYPFSVYCMFDDDDGAWTLLQRRVNSYVSFNRTWEGYRNSFGVPGPSSNFWLGLEKMHYLTTQRQYTIRFEITNWDGEVRSADYSMFYIKDESESYSLIYGEFAGGTLGDGLGDQHRGIPFTTLDQDQDGADYNCAERWLGGWWYTACWGVNLNGGYTEEADHEDTWLGIQWRSWVNKNSYKESAMKIKPTI